jgi:hypothetical protein
VTLLIEIMELTASTGTSALFPTNERSI